MIGDTFSELELYGARRAGIPVIRVGRRPDITGLRSVGLNDVIVGRVLNQSTRTGFRVLFFPSGERGTSMQFRSLKDMRERLKALAEIQMRGKP